MLDASERTGAPSLPANLFRAAVVISFLILGAQLWRLQIVDGPSFRQKADNNRVRVSPIKPPRGVIYDRRGQLLASNAPIFVASIVPADIPARRETEIYDRLAGLLSMSTIDLRRVIERRRSDDDLFTPVPVKYNVERTAALRIEEHHEELPGVVISVESTRKYSEGPLLAHLLGYTGLISPTLLSPAEYRSKIDREGYTVNDRIGAAGLEEQYEAVMRGQPGRRMYEVEASGRPVNEIRVENPDPGRNLILSLDLDLQRDVSRFLQEGLNGETTGVAIVMNPKTGDVLSMVSLPTYDDNIFADDSREAELEELFKDPSQPFFQRATSGLYPPGSTFKLVTAAAALKDGIANRNTVIESKGAIFVPSEYDPNYRQMFPDWSVLGKLNMVGALANSSNVYFFYLGGGYEPEHFQGLGNERLAAYARQFGYGSTTGIDLPDEAAGVIPDEAWKLQRRGERWVKGDTYNMSIGQGYVLSTPLQVANYTNALANGGKLVRPRLVKEIADTDRQQVRTVPPQVIREVDIPPQNRATILEGMEAGFSGVLLKDFRVPELRIAGKTGTGEYTGPRDANGALPTHGWFTGFAPIDDPEIEVTVFVEKGTGSKNAAPIAMRIIRQYFKLPQMDTGGAAPAAQPASAPVRQTQAPIP
ncbi:MAG TPA: penicillin-binding protein 2 [Chloroflexota bacterium]|jgi:penicillin-binding protein 2|nr:penicillin-binding protein 2 [Chloroflexota bacterium]